MKVKYLPLIAAVLAATSFALRSYIEQNGRAWWDTEWAGIELRSGWGASELWALRFSDGKAWRAGRLRAIVLAQDGLREGHFLWPKYRHRKMKPIQSPITVGGAGWVLIRSNNMYCLSNSDGTAICTTNLCVMSNGVWRISIN